MKLLNEFKPKDYIAIILLIGGLILISQGIDKIVSGILIAITAWYFGRRKDDETPAELKIIKK